MDTQKLFLEEMVLLGLRTLKLRKRLKLTQTQLGKKCEINRTEISRIENGNKNLEFFTIVKLADGLAIELVSLFDYHEKRPLLEIKRKLKVATRAEKEKNLLGERIQILRTYRGLTQVDIDIAIGLPDSDVSRIENAIGNYKFFSIFRIAKVLNVDVADLFDYNAPLPDNATFKGKK